MGKLEQNMLDVIQQVQSQELRVQDTDGKWCVLRIVPYRTMDNRIDGVVLSVMSETSGFVSKLEGSSAAASAPAAKKSKKKAAKASRHK
jgi:two-component system, chemotaxis family, CheB/CheR fusion protein